MFITPPCFHQPLITGENGQIVARKRRLSPNSKPLLTNQNTDILTKIHGSWHHITYFVTELTDAEKAALKKRAYRSPMLAAFLGFFLPPIAYLYIGKFRLAVLNLITLNFLLLGFIIVPLHARSAVKQARKELRAAGVPDPAD